VLSNLVLIIIASADILSRPTSDDPINCHRFPLYVVSIDSVLEVFKETVVNNHTIDIHVDTAYVKTSVCFSLQTLCHNRMISVALLLSKEYCIVSIFHIAIPCISVVRPYTPLINSIY